MKTARDVIKEALREKIETKLREKKKDPSLEFPADQLAFDEPGSRPQKCKEPARGLSEVKLEVQSVLWRESRRTEKNRLSSQYDAYVKISGVVYYWCKWEKDGHWAGHGDPPDERKEDWKHPFQMDVSNFMGSCVLVYSQGLDLRFGLEKPESVTLEEHRVGDPNATPFSGYTYTDDTGAFESATLTANGMDGTGCPMQLETFLEIPLEPSESVPVPTSNIFSVNSIGYLLWPREKGGALKQGPYTRPYFLESLGLQCHRSPEGPEVGFEPTPSEPPSP